MTMTDAVGGIIDRLLERRHGARYSPKWWKRFHEQSHHHGVVMLACPECPDAAELGRMIHEGPVITSYDDIQAALRAAAPPSEKVR